MALSFGIVLVCVLLFLAVRPKSPQPSQPLMQSPAFFTPEPGPSSTVQPAPINFREQLLSEEANEVQTAYREAANRKWREEVIAKASTLLTP